MRLITSISFLIIGLACHYTAFGQSDNGDGAAVTDTAKVDTISVQVIAVEGQTTDTIPLKSTIDKVEEEAVNSEMDSVGAELPIVQPKDSVTKSSPDTIPSQDFREQVDVDIIKSEIDTVSTATEFAAEVVAVVPDSIPTEPIILTPLKASEYLNGLISSRELWHPEGDSLKKSLLRLVNHYNEPYDSIRNRLLNFKWDSVKLMHADVVERDTLPLRWFDKSLFIVDTIPLQKNPLITKSTVVMRVIDPLSFSMLELKQDLKERIESLLEAKDTISENIIDRNYLESKNIQLYEITERGITPSIRYREGFRPYRFNNDSTELVMVRTRKAIVGTDGSPFRIVPNGRITDSLKIAIETLTAYTYNRDSILINIKSKQGTKTPMWLTTGNEALYRYWIKNSKNDSITIWIGNPSKRDIMLTLEEDVSVERFERRMVDDTPFTTTRPDRKLLKLKPLREIPVRWSYGIIGAYSLNESFFSNYWAQGGESSLTSVLDINAQMEYNNKESKLNWATIGRLRYGTTWTDDKGFRTTTDIVEVNSQYNRVLRDKVDLSSIFYMKSQVAKGYNYPNDSVAVSKFLNPGAITIGLGMEFKPYKKTSINFSPLSYRNTFVLDTTIIDQTAHGIAKDKHAKQELGGQLLVKNTLVFFKDMEIKNTVRLFSSYLDKPQNIDVDWEMSIEKQISIYFKIKLNLNLIYNDNILFPIVDGMGEPVLFPDGSQKKGPRTQFNQMLGLTLQLKI
ncbi:MAG: DUF3078 domain-containing protein [Bacteroidales bacterium]|nr:DUF3078 domain-containing protein [Bacteroidales bacterium]